MHPSLNLKSEIMKTYNMCNMCTCVFQVPKAEGELKDEAEMKEEVEK